MAERFNDSQMLRLVEIYKEHDNLWDMTHKLYKNRDAREWTYQRICEELKIPGLKLKDVPQKIKNLRSSYYQELKKIEKSLKDGATGEAVYKPKVSWFSLADGFFKTFHKNQQECLNGEEAATNKKKKLKKDETQEKLTRLEEIADSLAPPQTNEERIVEEDEHDSFGKYIATILRSMPREMSIIATTELQTTLSEIQLRILRGKQASSASTTCDQPPEYILSTTPICNFKEECEN